MRQNPDYEIVWEKLKFPDEKDEDDYNDEEYDDEPRFVPISSLLQPNQNPFFQIKTFDFWTGHTNFKISEPVAIIINRVLGVESVDIMSPYRFHISIGTRFVRSEVMSEIQAQVIEFLEKHEKSRRYEQHLGGDS